jgi:hypothetical protein
MHNPLKSVTLILRTGAAGALLLLALATVLAACRGGGANPGPNVQPPIILPTANPSACVESFQPEGAPQFSDIDPSRYIETESGVRYYDVQVGTGESPTLADAAIVEYTGWLENGCMFDTSYANEGGVTFPLIGVIAGWRNTFQDMKEGGIRVIEVPPLEAYGPVGRPPRIPPNATLIFHVHLLERLTIPEAQATLQAQQATATAEAADRNATATAAAQETSVAQTASPSAGTPPAGTQTPAPATPTPGPGTPQATSLPAPTVGP